MIAERIGFRDGAVTVPDAPGLGVTLDRDALAGLHERWKAMPHLHDRDDIAAMRRADPGYRAPGFPKY